jgi:hypothetical protein
MNISYRIAEIILIFEFSLITLVIFLSIASKIISYIKEKNEQQIRDNIHNYLKLLTKANKQFDPQQFPRRWQRLKLLLFSLHELDIQKDHWKKIKQDLIHSIILPLARKAARSHKWVSQFYAAQGFELYAGKEEDLLIAKLICSEVPLIRVAALRAALKCGSEIALNAIINQIQHQPYLTQSVYLQAFTEAPLTSKPFITRYLKSASSPSIRLTCYRILLNYLPSKIDWDITSDINSKNKAIKLVALKLLAYWSPLSAAPILAEQLKDEYWETKVVVLHALGYLPAQEIIPQIIECLQDSNWWVRLNAAQALKNLGEQGEHTLMSHQDLKTLEVVRHVLNIL